MRIGIDLGGTKTEVAAFTDEGEMLFRQREPTPSGHYDATLLLIQSLVRNAELHCGSSGSVGIGTPGVLGSDTGLMRNSNSTCLNQRSLKKDLEIKLQRPVRLANDANCFALSEAMDGAARGLASVFGVILGTGVGGGLVINGRLVDGPNAIAGEWGHNPLPWPEDRERPGAACYCGKCGCIETFLSGPGLERDFFKATGINASAKKISIDSLTDPVADSVMSAYENRLAKSLATVINVIDPEVIVLGGGVSNISRIYENVPRLWGQWVFAPRVLTRLVQHQHGDSSGVRGAARLWAD